MNTTTRCIQEFESACFGNAKELDDRIQLLMLAIDRLLIDVQEAPNEFDSQKYPDPPKDVYSDMYKAIGEAFPNIGFYNCVMDISDNIAQTDVLVGDAVDDIVDILLDLRETKWRFENTSKSDALFHYRLSFSSHWGLHARNLQLYLHESHH